MSNTTEAKCPFNHTFGGGTSNKDWWPNHLPLELLHQHSAKSNPLGSSFNYAPAVTVGLLVAVWIAWEVGAKHTFKGPVRTVDDPDVGDPTDASLMPA